MHPVIMKRFNFDWQPKRPFRALVLTFAVLALLFCIATPFMPDRHSRWLFLFAGLGYSAFLAFFTIGLCLLPRPIRSRVFTALFSVQAFAVFITAAIFCIAHFQLPLSLITLLTRSALWVLYPFGIAMLGFACYGWYFHLTHDATEAA